MFNGKLGNATRRGLFGATIFFAVLDMVDFRATFADSGVGAVVF
jgi:hypothetical protein